MNISIAERLRPFCRLPGTSTLLPGWGFQVQIFPCLIRIFNLDGLSPLLEKELTLDLKGPLEQFTIFNDLEKGRITVSGKSERGWVRYHLISAQNAKNVRLHVELGGENGIGIDLEGERHQLGRSQSLDLFGKDPFFEPYHSGAIDRLSLGCHKLQDWELVLRRNHLGEIFPFIYRLSCLINWNLIHLKETPASSEGTLSLLDDCRMAQETGRPEIGERVWKKFLAGAFHGMLVPQLEDSHFLGLHLPASKMQKSIDFSPLFILKESSRLIRELFIQQEGSSISILPFLFPSFHCGRLTDVPIEGGGRLSIEWSKKSIRRMMLHAGRDEELALNFRSSCRSYRIRRAGAKAGIAKNGTCPLFVEKNCCYLFDNFLT